MRVFTHFPALDLQYYPLEPLRKPLQPG